MPFTITSFLRLIGQDVYVDYVTTSLLWEMHGIRVDVCIMSWPLIREL
jgi:hypothetical protein